MLINNLSKHRIKYSCEKPKTFHSQRPSSLTVLPRSNSKTQRRQNTGRFASSSAHIHQIKPVTFESGYNINMRNSNKKYDSNSNLNKNKFSNRNNIYSSEPLIVNIASKTNIGTNKFDIENQDKDSGSSRCNGSKISFFGQSRLNDEGNRIIMTKKVNKFFETDVLKHGTEHQQKQNSSKNIDSFRFQQDNADYEDQQSYPKYFKRKIVQKKLKTNRCSIKKVPAVNIGNFQHVRQFLSQANDSSQISEQKNAKISKIENSVNKACLSTQSSQTNTRKLMSKTATKQSQQLIHIDAPSVNNQELFLQNLKANQVIFCKQCFRYVFAVEKYYHYPKCQGQLDCNRINSLNKYQIGLSKLNMLQQLSVYTQSKTAKVKQLMALIKSPTSIFSLSSVLRYQQRVSYTIDGSARTQLYSTRKYFSLDQIDLAVDYTYHELLSQQMSKIYTKIQKSILSMIGKSGQKYLCRNIAVDCRNQVDV